MARDVLKPGASRGEPDGQADSFLRQKEVSPALLLKLCAHQTKAKEHNLRKLCLHAVIKHVDNSR